MYNANFFSRYTKLCTLIPCMFRSLCGSNAESISCFVYTARKNQLGRKLSHPAPHQQKPNVHVDFGEASDCSHAAERNQKSFPDQRLVFSQFCFMSLMPCNMGLVFNAKKCFSYRIERHATAVNFMDRLHRA